MDYVYQNSDTSVSLIGHHRALIRHNMVSEICSKTVLHDFQGSVQGHGTSWNEKLMQY